MKKIVLLVIFCILMSSQTFANSDFKDIEGHWAKEAIKSMNKSGIINGYPDGTFKPEGTLTREQFAKLVALTFNLPLLQDNSTFSDVEIDRWSYLYIEASKLYLTGYFPPVGQPFFDPESNATREDVAVALVRTMKIDELINETILEDTFKDYKHISPNLRTEVAIAIENELLTGFPDKTFKPLEPVTRGQVATLLYRILKRSYATASQEVELEVIAPEVVNTNVVQLKATLTKGATLVLNDYDMEVVEGKFSLKVYLNQGEGEYMYRFIATLPNGKNKIVEKIVTYKVNTPTLTVEMPSAVDTNSVTINGIVKDDIDLKPTININGNSVLVSSDGSFTYTISLSQEQNAINIVAKNAYDKIASVNRTVVWNIPAPTIDLNYLPDSTEKASIKVYGSVTDQFGTSTVEINNSQVNVNSDNTFVGIVDLVEGSNTINVKATNKYNKSTQATRLITYAPVVVEEEVIEKVVEEVIEDKIELIIEDNVLKGYEGNIKDLVVPDGVEHIAHSAFKDCQTLETVVMPSSVIQIGAQSFQNCTNLKTVDLSATQAKTIYYFAFAHCTSLTDIKLPIGLEHIVQEAFKACENLVAITIPATVTKVDSHSFRECYSLTDIYFLGDAPEVGKYPFSYIQIMPRIHTLDNSTGFTDDWINYIQN